MLFFNGTSDRVISSFYVPFKISNMPFTHNLVKDWIKFQFASFSKNAKFPPLNEQYKASPDMRHLISLFSWDFSSTHDTHCMSDLCNMKNNPILKLHTYPNS